MLVDDVTVTFSAGQGGKGAVAFNKVPLSLGPTGGDGGRGGNIYFEGVSDIGALSYFSNKKEIRAEDGKDGRGQFIDGRDGEDLVLKVPAGTRITNMDTGFAREVSRVGERILVVGGGIGGRGNFKFRSSTNTSPKESEEGTQGDQATLRLELLLIADVGLMGLPNAGKSSLLNELTAAKSKIASYAFTTLEPHLGSYYGLIIADIPGLIEGASQGKGLGFKFLKHVERTNTLVHLISAESDDVVHDYRVVRNELEAYDPALTEKEEHVFLSKCDAISKDEMREKIAALKKAGIKAEPLSLVEPETMDALRKLLNEIKDRKEAGK